MTLQDSLSLVFVMEGYLAAFPASLSKATFQCVTHTHTHTDTHTHTHTHTHQSPVYVVVCLVPLLL